MLQHIMAYPAPLPDACAKCFNIAVIEMSWSAFQFLQTLVRPPQPIQKPNPFTEPLSFFKPFPSILQIPFHQCKITQVDRSHHAALIALFRPFWRLY